MQRQFRKGFQIDPLMRLNMTRMRDEFEADGTAENVHEKRSGRPRTSTSTRKQERVLETYHKCPRKSVRQTSREAINDDDPVRKVDH